MYACSFQYAVGACLTRLHVIVRQACVTSRLSYISAYGRRVSLLKSNDSLTLQRALEHTRQTGAKLIQISSCRSTNRCASMHARCMLTIWMKIAQIIGAIFFGSFWRTENLNAYLSDYLSDYLNDYLSDYLNESSFHVSGLQAYQSYGRRQSMLIIFF